MSNQRNSNVELLRILCMLMVVILHFNNHCANPGLLGFPDELTSQYTWGFLIESFCIVAVNCFVLISGYFGIKLKGKSVLKFYLQCFVMGLLAYLLYVLFTPDTLSIKPLLGRLMALTHNHWWFVVSYFCLMLFSPILNGAVKALSRKQLLMSVILFGIVILYFGWYKHLENTNSGYSFVNFVFLYLIGRYVGEYVSVDKIQKYRWYSLGGYVLGSIGIFLLVVCRYYTDWNIRFEFEYDHPFIILSACCLLLFFLSFNFQSKFVNWCANSVFSAYLLQESPYFGDRVLYPFVGRLFANVELLERGGVFVVALTFLVIAILVDKFIKPLSNFVLHVYDKYVYLKITKYDSLK